MAIAVSLVCLFAVFYSGFARNTQVFLDEVTKCCQHAILETGRQRNPNCEAIGRQTERAVQISGLICRTSAELCCIKQIQEKYCDMGKSVAKKNERCGVETVYGAEDHQECCYCCYLGMEAKRRKMGCRRSVLGFPCEKAFLSCCLSNEPTPTDTPNPFGPTTKRQTCASLGCSQSCLMLKGVPTCVCRSGFEMSSDGRTCLDLNECRDIRKCQDDEVCENTYGSYRCRKRNIAAPQVKCPKGFKVDPRGRQCQDIDECNINPYPCKEDEDCENNPGSYECKAKCPVTMVYRNNRCEKKCRQGTSWDGTRCADIDECKKSRKPCRRNEICENIVGSYRCNCKRGFERVGSTCRDIDECRKSTKPCRENEICQNIIGSYRCKCKRGYKRVGSTCQDVNECERNLCRPNERCVNKPGTYRCERQSRCGRGYRRVGRRCVDVDECLENRRACKADEECENIAGSYRCKLKCSRGYERVGSDCRDINECRRGNPCGPNERCLNRLGSYTCERNRRTCSSGYKLVAGSCRDIDECAIDRICRPPRVNCVNIPGSYRCEYPPCQQGYERGRNGRCKDVDECATGKNECSRESETCYNFEGSYSCRCKSGFIRRRAQTTCQDVNECQEYSACQQKCVNTLGSYTCSCRQGYKLVGKTNCLDINECREDNPCQHRCINTQGSYRCACKQGYSLQGNGKCRDIDECSRKETNYCSWKCKNNGGSYTCVCPRGYSLVYRKSCQNENECAAYAPCSSDRLCVDTRGGYKCIPTDCPNSFFIKRSSTHCARKNCNADDKACLSEIRKSIRWYGQGFPNNAQAGAFYYTYRITTTGYYSRPEIVYSIKSGNYDGVFGLESPGYGRSILKNVKALTGPREYRLEFVGEVVSERKVTAQFVTYLHVYVSQYDF